MTHAKIRRLAFGSFAALALAACQTTLSLDTDNLERVLPGSIAAQDPSLVVTAVSCPERPLQQGDIFDCTATTADGRTLTISVTQTDAIGNINWRITNIQ